MGWPRCLFTLFIFLASLFNVIIPSQYEKFEEIWFYTWGISVTPITPTRRNMKGGNTHVINRRIPPTPRGLFEGKDSRKRALYCFDIADPQA